MTDLESMELIALRLRNKYAPRNIQHAMLWDELATEIRKLILERRVAEERSK